MLYSTRSALLLSFLIFSVGEDTDVLRGKIPAARVAWEMLREARVWGRSWRTVGNWLPHPPTPTLLSSWTTCPCSGKQVNRWRQVISCDNWWYLGDITRHLASEGYYMWHLWHQMNWFGERWKKSSTVVTRLLVPFGPVFSAQWTKSFCVPKNTYWEKVVVLARTKQVNMWIMFLIFLWQITFWWRGHW